MREDYVIFVVETVTDDHHPPEQNRLGWGNRRVKMRVVGWASPPGNPEFFNTHA
jgi:hypothetical protein